MSKEIIEQFFTYYEIPKVKYTTPGRDYDCDGELCSWYEEEDWPEITGDIFFELLQLYLRNNEPFNCIVKENDLVCTLLKNMLDYESLSDYSYKEDVQEIFAPYIDLLEDEV